MDYAEAGYTTDERSNLISLLEDGFVDAYRCLYPDKEDAFTWWSNRLNKREQDRGWRLDYFLVSSSIQSDIQDVVIHNNISGSDHCLITLEVDISDADI